MRRGLGRLWDFELVARQDSMGARLGRVLATALARRTAGAVQILPGVVARLPVLGVGVAFRDLIARVRLHAVAAEQTPLEALFQGLVVGDGRFVARRRHRAHEALVIAQSELRHASVVRRHTPGHIYHVAGLVGRLGAHAPVPIERGVVVVVARPVRKSIQ